MKGAKQDSPRTTPGKALFNDLAVLSLLAGFLWLSIALKSKKNILKVWVASTKRPGCLAQFFCSLTLTGLLQAWITLTLLCLINVFSTSNRYQACSWSKARQKTYMSPCGSTNIYCLLYARNLKRERKKIQAEVLLHEMQFLAGTPCRKNAWIRIFIILENPASLCFTPCNNCIFVYVQCTYVRWF